MMKVYICSPYRAMDGAELDRNIEYAQAITKQALKAGLAPITPHLYMTQCLDESKVQERAQGLAAGLEILKGCDFVIVGDKYGISKGMRQEIETANRLGIAVVKAERVEEITKRTDKLREQTAHDYAKTNSCKFCKGSRLHSCTGYSCIEPYQKACDYAMRKLAAGCVVVRIE